MGLLRGGNSLTRGELSSTLPDMPAPSHQVPLLDETVVLKLAHLSDLHFRAGTTTPTAHGKHSLKYLRAAQEVIEREKPGYVIVTGDLSNGGDVESLNHVRDWLYNKVSVGYGEELGLRLQEKCVPLLVIPGNHDAWNSSEAGGPYHVRWQRALSNFNIAFPSMLVGTEDRLPRPPGTEETVEPSAPLVGPEFDWISAGDCGVFIAAFSSCFCAQMPSPDQIAVGKLTIEQTRVLLDCVGTGMRGEFRSRRGEAVSASQFARSLKVAVMHHYLFEPEDAKAEPLLRLSERRRVIRNLLYSQFDIVLCGHKHFIDTRPECYGEQFDSRSRARYLINIYRRALNVESLPVQYAGTDGKKISKYLSMFVNWMLRRDHGVGVDPDKLIDKLQAVSLHPALARAELSNLDFVDDEEEEKIFEISSEEAARIGAALQTAFTPDERAKLAEYVRTELKQALGGLATRPFTQIMSGSTTKKGSSPGRVRGLNVYEILRGTNSWVVRCTPHQTLPSADPSVVVFTPALPTHLVYPDSRTPSLFTKL